MIRILALAIAALLAFAATASAETVPALDQGRPTLRAEAIVTGAVVRIGDLIDHAGIVAGVPIFRAPDLGVTGTVSTDAVIEAVRPHALIGIDTAGLSEVTVTRASRPIPAADIESRIVQALAAQYALGAPKDIVLNFDHELHTLHVEPAAKGTPRVADVTYDARNGRFTATLDIPAGATSRGVLRLTGRATATVETLSLARAVARGEIIKQADVVVERHDRAEVHGVVLGKIEQAVGLAARNALQIGTPLRPADLMKPELVQRNEAVTLVYRVPGIVLTVRGKAAEGGAEGDVIVVTNEQTKRPVQGVITGQGRVTVSGASPRIAANILPTAPAMQANGQ
jgi:flagella basal body P-ring formation protein FlgA